MEPRPHHCEARPPTGAARHAGCPHWPGCLYPGWHDDDMPDDDEIPEVGRTLVALLGFAAAAVIFLIAVAILMPVIL